MVLHINIMRDKSYIIISVAAEKNLTNYHSFMIKTLNKLGIEGMHLNITKAI